MTKKTSLKKTIAHVQKRKKEISQRQEQRDTPIPYARVHETDKKNPKIERKQGKRLAKEAMQTYD